jgi:hypothetical protein
MGINTWRAVSKMPLSGRDNQRTQPLRGGGADGLARGLESLTETDGGQRSRAHRCRVPDWIRRRR